MGNVRGGTLVQVRVVLGGLTVDAVFRLPATASATFRLPTGHKLASMRIVDERGAVHRPVAVHLSEVSNLTG
jgi:hypothetical protein